MSCNCQHRAAESPEQIVSKVKKGTVKFCDVCDPCNECVTNVKICAFVVPTLEEGRYFKNSFIFVQEDDSVYFISDDRSEIPFGSRPKFIDDFDPTDAAVHFKSTVVYDVKNNAGYVYDPEGNMTTIAMSSAPVSSLTGGEGIIVTATGGDYTVSIDPTAVASADDLHTVTLLVTNHTGQINALQDAQDTMAGDIETIEDDLDHTHDLVDDANELAVEAKENAAAAQQTANEALSGLNNKQDRLTAGDNISILNNEISATDTTYAPFVGATSSTSGEAGLVPAPQSGEQNLFLTGAGTWQPAGVPNDGVLTIQRNGTTIDTFSANSASNKTINISVPTTAADVNALSDSTKYGASIELTLDSSTYAITAKLKAQDGTVLGTSQIVDLPIESMVVNGTYDSTNKKIILTLQNGNTIDVPVADLVAGLQSEITSTNMLSSDLVDDTNAVHLFVTAAEKATWNASAANTISSQDWSALWQ